MVLPPNLIRSTGTLTTSAVANTGVSGTLVASPGAGLRWRLWWIEFSPNDTSQAVANWRAAWTNAAAGGVIGQVTGSNFLGPPPVWYPGGAALGAALDLGFATQSALVSMALRWVALYTSELA